MSCIINETVFDVIICLHWAITCHHVLSMLWIMKKHWEKKLKIVKRNHPEKYAHLVFTLHKSI